MKRYSVLVRWTIGTALVYVMGYVSTVSAADSAAQSLVGVWKLTSYSREEVESGKKVDLFGQKPSGYMTYSPNGRMMSVLVGDNRAPAAAAIMTDAERVALYRTIIASYAGTYTVEGDKVTHHVDVSWNQAWTGTKQTRYFAIEGTKLRVFNPPRKSPADGKMIRSVLIFEKVE